MQILETQDPWVYTEFIHSENASILQSWEWGDFQRRLNRKVWRLILTSNTGKPLLAAQIISMPLPRGKSYFYCPRGPVVASSPHQNKIWCLFLDKLQDLVLIEKPIFLRIDPLVTGFSERFKPSDIGFRKINWEIQPRDTLLLDLHQPEDRLLHSMKPKTRYNIHLATRKGVVVESTQDSKSAKVFWELLRETTTRDGFSPHPYLYYVNLLNSLGRANMAELLIAYYQRRPLASGIVSYFGDTATYLHGASSDKVRGAMAPYLIQWEAIRVAKSHGMHWYDFGGVAPSAGERHAWAGITRFKQGFGGSAIRYVGAYDLPYSKAWYALYAAARKLKRTIT